MAEEKSRLHSSVFPEGDLSEMAWFRKLCRRLSLSSFPRYGITYRLPVIRSRKNPEVIVMIAPLYLVSCLDRLIGGRAL